MGTRGGRVSGDGRGPRGPGRRDDRVPPGTPRRHAVLEREAERRRGAGVGSVPVPDRVFRIGPVEEPHRGRVGDPVHDVMDRARHGRVGRELERVVDRAKSPGVGDLEPGQLALVEAIRVQGIGQPRHLDLERVGGADGEAGRDEIFRCGEIPGAAGDERAVPKQVRVVVVHRRRPHRNPLPPHPEEERALPTRFRARERQRERDARALREQPVKPALPAKRGVEEVEVPYAVFLVVNPVPHRGHRGRRGNRGGVAHSHAPRRRGNGARAPGQPQGLLVRSLRLQVIRRAAERQVVAKSGSPGRVDVNAISGVEDSVPFPRDHDRALAQRVGAQVHIDALGKIPRVSPEDAERRGIDAGHRNARRRQVGRTHGVKAGAEHPEPHPRARGLDAERARVSRRASAGADHGSRAGGGGRARRVPGPDGAIPAHLTADRRDRPGGSRPLPELRADRLLPGHLERDSFERRRLAAPRIPPDRPQRHLENALDAGRRGHRAPERRLRRPRAPGAVFRPFQIRGDLRGAHGPPYRAVGYKVRKRNWLERAQRSFRAGRGGYAGVDPPGHAEQERDRGELRRSRGRVERAPRERDLGQVLAEDLLNPDLGLGNGYGDAVACRRDRFDARHGGGLLPGGDARPDGEEEQERKSSEGEAQAFAIRSASSINMTGMSSTIGYARPHRSQIKRSGSF